MTESPELMRRQLRTTLRRCREVAMLTQEAVAATLDWSVSKLIRIENGSVGATPTDVRALLEVYGVRDSEKIGQLVQLARDSRKQPWAQYKDVYSQAALTLFAYEAAADTIYKYEPIFIPGLLQVEEYSRALFIGLGNRDNVDIDRMVSARLARQEILDRDAGPKLHFIIGEAAIRCVVGGPAVMTRQFELLKYVSKRPHVSLQIMPFLAGAHPKMGGAFTILEFDNPDIEDLLYLEHAGGDSVSRDNPEDIAEFRNDFKLLQEMASEPSDFAAALDVLIEDGGHLHWPGRGP